MSQWQEVSGNLASPKGFSAAAAAAGIKKKQGELDLALVYSESEQTTAAGMFTTNLAAAAPVRLCQRNLRASGGRARAIVVNAGNANACTGRAGMRAAELTVAAAGKLLGLPSQEVLVASTGVIGVPLKLELILDQLPALKESLSAENASAVERAIMTTDTFPKLCVLRSERDGRAATLAGIAKGAGMIHPRMATMISVITTDVAVGPRMLANVLRAAVEVSFNRITVDGDTSTNDTVVALASGLSGIAARPGDQSRAWFLDGLTALCQSLARMIARDGEGSRKLVTIEVQGARLASDAERIARAVANSPLVKTAIAGSDPNWGRIMCAAGYSGAKFDPAIADIYVNHLALCRRGIDAGFNDAAARRELDQKEVTVRLNLHQGKASARFWTCDFTQDYIDINASYRT